MPRDPTTAPRVRLGTASWAIPAASRDRFGVGGSVLERYATRFDAVEINSSFYKPHRPHTYARWAASVPAHFRFAVKVPKAITHEARLRDCEATLRAFLDQVAMLGDRLGPLLIQLPPSFGFEEGPVEAFMTRLRAEFAGAVACEPRHASWFTPAADDLLRRMRAARVAADPALCPEAGRPGGWRGFAYHRLHGSPHLYHSAYSPLALEALREGLAAEGAREPWCVFDNTALGAATEDALRLMEGLSGHPAL